MREILFRGKRVDNGEWVEGVPTKDAHGEMVIVESLFECEEYLCIGANAYYVDENSIGQYTGLTDKNGKKIFEGDIVDILTENEERGVITYNDGCFIVEADGFVLTFIDHLYGTDVEVLGNLHDNPELLKGEEL